MESKLVEKLEKFSRKFGHLISSGVPIINALEIICMEDQGFSDVLKRIIEMIRKGKRFSETLCEFPGFFSKSYLGMVEAGEGQGMLDSMMEKIADGLKEGIIPPGKGESRLLETGRGSAPDFIREIFESAISKKASDIHFFPSREGLSVQYRIEGRLNEFHQVGLDDRDPLVAELKIIFHCDPLETQLPQDSRIMLPFKEKSYDLKVNFLPVCLGEKVTVSILCNSDVVFTPQEIFADSDDLENFEKLLSQPYGLVLISGMSGSGKTTTAYAALNAIHRRGGAAIATVEDPVEHILDGIYQTMVLPELGLDLQKAVAAVMRSDPDVLYFSEIKDEKNLSIAIKVATTGHLVFSIMWCADVMDTLRRLVGFNVPGNLLSSALSGIVSQRLIRKVCSKCAQPSKKSLEALKELGISKSDSKKLLAGEGCENCNQSGYRGKIALYEIFLPNKDFKDVLMTSDMKKIESFMAKQRYRRTREKAIDLALSGKTTVAEVLRILGPSH